MDINPTTPIDKVFSIRKAEGESRYRFVITTGDVDRDREILDPDGLDSAEFMANPVVLWCHDMGAVIGRGTGLTREGKGWTGEMEFLPPGVDPDVDIIRKKVDLGFIRSASVRFLPLEWESGKVETDGYYTKYTKWKLLEWSIVTIPANPWAGIIAQGKADAAAAWTKNFLAGRDPQALSDLTDLTELEIKIAGEENGNPAGPYPAEGGSTPPPATKTVDEPQTKTIDTPKKSGAELSRKNRETLHECRKLLKDVHDKMSDLCDRNPIGRPDDEDEDEGKQLKADPPAKSADGFDLEIDGEGPPTAEAGSKSGESGFELSEDLMARIVSAAVAPALDERARYEAGIVDFD